MKRASLFALLGASLGFAAPVLATGKTVTIDDTMVFPESIAADKAGNLYASSLKGIIYRATPGSDKAVAWIKPDDTNKLLWTLGVFPHEASNTLWVCTTPAAFLSPPRIGDAALVAFDLKTGAFKARYVLPLPTGDKAPPTATCNDIAVGQRGKVYVTDTGAGRLFSLAPDAKALKLEAADPLLNGVEGPAFSDDGILYVNNTRQNTILRVNRDGKDDFLGFTQLSLSQPFTGGDAFRHYKGNQFLQAETGGNGRLTLVTITGDHADLKVLNDNTGGAAAATFIGDIAYTAPGKIQYLFSPDLKGKDPGAFVIAPTPIGAGK